MGYGLDDGVIPRWVLRCLPTQLANGRGGVADAANYVSTVFSRESGVECLAVAGAPFKHVQAKI